MRNAGFQGQWYPMRQQLRTMLDSNYNYNSRDDLLFLISPHAGLSYCAEVQGAVFSVINPVLYAHVVVLGVAHRFHLRGLAETPFTQWANPIDSQHPMRIRSLGLGEVHQSACSGEHSAEILFPYLARVFEGRLDKVDFSVVYCGNGATSDDIGKLPFGKDTLYVISSDFCHYGPNFDFTPLFKGKSADETIDMMNMAAFEGIKRGSKYFVEACEKYDNTVCGLHTIDTGLKVIESRQKYSAELVSYTKSGEIRRNGDSSVSYMGIIGLTIEDENL